MLRIIMMRAHRRVTVIRRVCVAVRMTIVRRDAIWRLNVGHDVVVRVQKTLIEAVTHLRMLLHRMVVVVKARHLHHSDAVVVL